MLFTPRRSIALLPLGLLLVAPMVSAEIVIEERSLSQPSPTLAAPVVTAPVPVQTNAPDATAIGQVPERIIEVAVPNDNRGTPIPETSSNWELYSQMQQMQQEVAHLRGQVEEQGHLLEHLQNDLRTRYNDLDQRLQLQQELLKQTPVTTLATAETEKPAAQENSVEDEKKAYLAAYDTFRTGGPDKAIAPMQAFVKQHPESSLTPGAFYWLGEFYLNATKPDLVKARQQFDTVLTKYPDNTKAPAALYKVGSILDLQGKPDEARQKMQDLMKRYPKSPEASLADTWLKALQASQTPEKLPATPTTAKPVAKPAANKR